MKASGTDTWRLEVASSRKAWSREACGGDRRFRLARGCGYFATDEVRNLQTAIRDGANPRQVLWTGGFDSTYWVCNLLLVERVDVQPIYVIDTNRPSTIQELSTMARMRSVLLERARPTRLLPTRILLRDDYQILPDHQRWFESIRARAHVGSQYLWLASVAEAEGWDGVDLAMERFPSGREMAKIVFKRPDEPELSDNEEAQLFRYWRFPVLHLTKKEMLENAQAHGFDDIVLMRWFCHRPIGSRACGRCRPCRIALRDGMAQDVEFAAAPVRWIIVAIGLARRFRRNCVSSSRV